MRLPVTRFLLIRSRYPECPLHIKPPWYSLRSVASLPILQLVRLASYFLDNTVSSASCVQVSCRMSSHIELIHCRFGLLLSLEACWNTFPSTNISSTVLLLVHALLLVASWRTLDSLSYRPARTTPRTIEKAQRGS